MISRRHTLALLAASALPRPAFAERPRIELRPDLARHFSDEGTAGAFAALIVDSNTIAASDDARIREAILPASTFKIPNSLIALETGVVADADKDVFKWDGKTYAIKEWNRDHTLRTAIAASAVPVYQEIARRIGADRMQAYLDRLAYGNRNIGGGIDRFWLTGEMRISPLQQIDFLDRLQRGTLPVSKRAQDLTRDILPVTKVGTSIIRAKTGLIGVDDITAVDGIKTSVGWIVGWAEKANARTVFALNCDIREPRHIASRMTLAQQCLSDIGAI